MPSPNTQKPSPVSLPSNSPLHLETAWKDTNIFPQNSLILEFGKHEGDKVGNFSHLEEFPHSVLTFLQSWEEINVTYFLY